MTKATDQAAATSSTSGTSSTIDVDAEHKPDVARRASQAGLKRAENANASGTEDQRAMQGVKANASTTVALNDAVNYATKEMLVMAHHVNEVANAPDDAAGWSRRVDAINAHISTASDSVDRLTREVGNALTAGVKLDSLQHAMAVFDRAFTRFETAVGEAVRTARLKQQTFSPALAPLEQQVSAMYGRLGWTATQLAPTVAPGSIAYAALDKADAHEVIQKALDSNTVALIDSAQKARMSLKAMTKDIDNDAGQAIAHVFELEKLVTESDPKTLHSRAKQVQQATNEMDHLIQEAGQGTSLGTRLGKAAVANRIHTIRDKLKSGSGH